MKKKIAAGCSGCFGIFVLLAIAGNYLANKSAAEDLPAMLQAMEVGDVAVVEQWYEKHGRLDTWPEDSYERYWYWKLQQASRDSSLDDATRAYFRLSDRGFDEYADAQDLLESLLKEEEERIRRERCSTCDATGTVRQVRACSGGSPGGCFYGKPATRVYSSGGYSHYYCEGCHKDLQRKYGGPGIFSVSYLTSTATCKDCNGTGKRR